MAMDTERILPEGVWSDLLPHALSIIEDIKKHGVKDPFWTFGGGDVNNQKQKAPCGAGLQAFSYRHEQVSTGNFGGYQEFEHSIQYLI